EIGITPKLRSASEIPIVAQIWLQSARSCSPRNRITCGVAVVPEVSFNSIGGLSAESEKRMVPMCRVRDSAEHGEVRRKMEVPADTTALALQISSAASR